MLGAEVGAVGADRGVGAEGPAGAEGRGWVWGADWFAFREGGAGGAGVGREGALEAETRCDRSHTEVESVSRSSAEATSLARTEEMSCSLVRSSPFSLVSAASCVDTVSS